MKTPAVMKYEAICGELLINPALPFEDEKFILFMQALNLTATEGKIKPPKHWELIKNFLKENY
jgi:hypothetical protein